MKGRGGFTLIELLVVLALMAVLAAIGFNLNGWETKFRAESELKQVYSDLMNAREQAASQKRWFHVRFGMNNNVFSYKIFEDNSPAPDGDDSYDAGDGQAGPNWKWGQGTYLFVNEAQNPLQLDISPDGLMVNPAGQVSPTVLVSWTPGAAATVNTANAPQLDCISWTPTNISMGSWQGTPSNGKCSIN